MMFKKTEWQTGDDCINCGHPGMVFKLKGWNGETNKKYWGVLSCPSCRAAITSYCDETQVPEELKTK